MEKNKAWREKREETRNRKIEEQEAILCPDDHIEEALKNELKCPVCDGQMMPPYPIFQCEDGHVLCSSCRELPTEVCPTCMGPIIGRNILVENISAIVFSKDVIGMED